MSFFIQSPLTQIQRVLNEKGHEYNIQTHSINLTIAFKLQIIMSQRLFFKICMVTLFMRTPVSKRKT